MNDSLFCPKCGMLKSNCVCENNKNSNNNSSKNNKSNDLLQYMDTRKKTKSPLINDIPGVYSIEDHRLSDDRIGYLKDKYP